MINWGITGFGVIAKEFEKAINTTKKNKILSICTQKNIENKSDKIFFYKNEKEMLSLKDLDVVYISNLNNMHLSSCLNCLKHNKNFIVEKPTFVRFEDYIKFKNNFSEELFFLEGYMNLYYPQINKLIDILKNNEIGEIKKIDCKIGFSIKKKRFGFTFYKFDKSNRLRNPKKFGGAISDLGCYGIATINEILSRIFNKPLESKIINIKNFYGSSDVDEHSQCSLVFDNDIISEIECSIIKNIDSFIIYGTKGKIFLTDPWLPSEKSQIIIFSNKEKKINTGENHLRHHYLINYFNNCLTKEKKIRVQIVKNNLLKLENNTKIIDSWRNKKTS